MVYQNKIFSFKVKRQAKNVFSRDVERTVVFGSCYIATFCGSQFSSATSFNQTDSIIRNIAQQIHSESVHPGVLIMVMLDDGDVGTTL